jgi:leucyl/phenylalanyl-tRNA--protein transferase
MNSSNASIFPCVDEASEDGLLAIGGSLDIETLTTAYKSGIFPWPVQDEYPLTWFAPNPRGIILKEDIHFSKSLLKFVKKSPFTVKVNIDFDKVIYECAKAKRKNEEGTWILEPIIRGYSALFDAEKAYCFSVYKDNELVGGLYGVCFGNLLSGESMFFKENNASKQALYSLLNFMIQADIPFIDTQMVTPVIKTFGGKNIDRDLFMLKLKSLDTEISREELFSSYNIDS